MRKVMKNTMRKVMKNEKGQKGSIEKCYSMMIFSKTSTETIPLKDPKKTLKITLKRGMSMENFLKIMTYYILLKRS